MYDKETQIALDEVDRNIKARTRMLTINSFGCKSMTTLLMDDILNYMYKVRNEIIATATPSGACVKVKRMPFPDNEQQFNRDVSAIIEDQVKRNPWRGLEEATDRACKAMHEFGRVAKEMGASSEAIECELNKLIKKASNHE